MTFSSQSFAAADGTSLVGYSGWAINTNWSSASGAIINGGRLFGTGDFTAALYSSDVPPSADYSVSATIYPVEANTSRNAGVMARVSTSAATGYMARYRRGTGIQLFKYVGSSTGTQLGSTVAGDIDVGSSAVLTIRCVGSSISVLKDGVTIISVTDTGITAAGRAGIWLLGGGVGTGVAVDDWFAAEPAPSLSSPTAIAATSTTANGSVTTDTASGTLYRLASTNATETVATVKAAALTTTVTATGAQAVSFTGLSPSTTYYAHFVHTSTGGSDSSRVSSASFTTPAGPATATTLTGPAGGTVGAASSNFTVGANGSITGTVTVTPSDGGDGGTFTPTSVAISSGTPTATFTYTPGSVGAKTISISDTGSLTDATPLTYTATLTAGTLTSSPLKNNTGTVLAAVAFEAYVSNPTSGALVVKKTGLTSNGSGVVSFSDGAVVAATSYRVVWRRTDTGAEGLETLTGT